ncbi:MAG TPA: XisH family protein [Leptolyngbyaceae cyanobacterium]
MSAKDLFHDVVKKALQKEGWKITHDPLTIPITRTTNMYIDLGAEKIIAADRDGQKIAVEIKTFLTTSELYEFHLAVGQYINYRYALEDREPERILYLAVPLEIYDDFFTMPFVQKVIEGSQINLLIYDVQREEISLWKT